MTKTRIFTLTFFLATLIFLTLGYVKREVPGSADLRVAELSSGVSVTSQLESGTLEKIREFRTLVCMRPDGEAADQPPSADIARAAAASGMRFHYVPVPHGDIPEAEVARLAEIVGSEPKPLLLYCRTGKRAVRLFALAEASRPDGPDLDALLRMVQTAGFTAEDLTGEIKQWIARRTPPAIAPIP